MGADGNKHGDPNRAPAPDDATLPAKGLGRAVPFDATATAAPVRAPRRGRVPQRGDQLDRFVVLDKLGEGGMGVVLSAYDPNLDRKVAIKLIRSAGVNPAMADHARARLRREAQAMAKVRHPNVVAVFDAGTAGADVFVAMEYVDGGTLRSWLADHVPEPGVDDGRRWRVIVDAYMDAARGLEAAHAAGIIHRDFKPENVLVDATGRPQVTDFGLASVLDSDEPIADDSLMPDRKPVSLTLTGAIMGTPRYMAPEQHLGQPADERTDQFSLCVALWEALYSQSPFEGDTMQALAAAVTGGAVRAPATSAGVPRRVREALERGLRSDPAERFASIRELRERLQPAPRRFASWFAAGGVLVAVGAVAWAGLGRSQSPDAGAMLRAATEAARACDCALISFELPPGATLIGLREMPGNDDDRPWAPGPRIDHEAARQATGQFALGAGRYLVDYAVDDGGAASFAFVASGFGEDRRLELPAIVEAEGFAFVAGGEVVIGGKQPGEGPPADLQLAPYLIARHESKRRQEEGFAAPGLFSAAAAVELAEAAGARLPTAAEWEWAARLGLGEGMLEDSDWEWTSTLFRPYPYALDGRDFAPVDAELREIRGGCSSRPCAHRPTARREGHSVGGAQLRLARSIADPLLSGEPLRVAVILSDVPQGTGSVQKWVVSDGDLGFLLDLARRWLRSARATHFALAPEERCREVREQLVASGVAAARIWGDPVVEVPDGLCEVRVQGGDPEQLGLHRLRGRVIVTDTKIEILDPVEFDGEDVTPASLPILHAIAGAAAADDVRKLYVWVNAETRADQDVKRDRARARRLRELLIERGVPAERIETELRVLAERQAEPCRISERERSLARARNELFNGLPECEGDHLPLPRASAASFSIDRD